MWIFKTASSHAASSACCHDALFYSNQRCRLRSRSLFREQHPRRCFAAVEDRDDQENSTESLFLKELKRRGISSRKSDTESTAQTTTSAPPRAPEEAQRSQLEVSRALNSEGLEGLIPRAKELLKLGLSFFLAFGPLIIGIVGLALTLYFLFGTQFVHGGRSGMAMPQYVDPYELLGQPTVDPTVPLR